MSIDTEWIRPWFPAGWEGHVAADCPELLRQVSEPVEGPGWLDPHQGIVCLGCVPSWNAECATCGESLTADLNREDDGPFTESDARQWKRDHECYPVVRLIAPSGPEPAPFPAGVVLLPLF